MRNLHVFILAARRYTPKLRVCDTLFIETAFNAAYCLKVITDISAIDITVNIPLYAPVCGLTFSLPPLSRSIFHSQFSLLLVDDG